MTIIRRPFAASVLALALMVAGCGRQMDESSRAAWPLLGTTRETGTSREDLTRTVVDMTSRLAGDAADVPAAVRLAEALLRQARATGNAGLTLEAETRLRAAVARRPDDYASCRMLAAALSSGHRFREAVDEARRCQVMRSDDAWLYGVLGDALLELGREAEAFDAFDRMARLKPTAAAYARVSLARERQGDVDAALELMQMALSAVPPGDIEAMAWHRSELGRLHLGQGRVADARREFDHASFLYPDYLPALEGRARVLARMGRTAEALAIAQPLAAASSQAPLLELTATLLRDLGRVAEADAHDRLAVAQREIGR